MRWRIGKAPWSAASPNSRRNASRLAASDAHGVTAARSPMPSRRSKRTCRARSEECLDPGLGATEDQRVNVVRAFVGVDGLEIAQHAHHVELVRYAVAAMDVARHARDLERLAAIVALEQRHRRRRGAALLQQPPEPERRVQAERDLGLHVGELLLDELVGGERTAELLAIERVLARPMPAELRRADRAPGNAGARHVEAAEGAAEAFGVRQHVLLWHKRILEHDLAGDRRAQRKLAFDLRRGQTLG